jgi:hypothetical protein
MRIWSRPSMLRGGHGGAHGAERRAWGSVRAATSSGGGPSSSAWAPTGSEGGFASLVIAAAASDERVAAVRCASGAAELRSTLPPATGDLIRPSVLCVWGSGLLGLALRAPSCSRCLCPARGRHPRHGWPEPAPRRGASSNPDLRFLNVRDSGRQCLPGSPLHGNHGRGQWPDPLMPPWFPFAW